MGVMKMGVCLLIAINAWAAPVTLLGTDDNRVKGQITDEFLGIKPFGNSAQLFDLLNPILPANPIILEAGAYNGEDTVAMLQLRPDATIHSFEPVPDVYKKLAEKVKPYPAIHTYKLALGDKIGVAQFFVSSTMATGAIGDASSSLLAPKEHLVYASHISFKPINVKTTTIDAWAQDCGVEHVDFMWLDMQGYELNALKASPKVLKTVKALMLEVEFVEAYKGQYLYHDVKQWLESQGFVLAAVHKDLSLTWYCDVLFMRKQ